MIPNAFDEATLKNAFKAAIIEVLQERRDLVREVLEEVWEDVGLIQAIAEGEQTVTVTRDEIFALFESGA